LLFSQRERALQQSFVWEITVQVVASAKHVLRFIRYHKALLDPPCRLTWHSSLQTTPAYPAVWTSLEAPAFATSPWTKHLGATSRVLFLFQALPQMTSVAARWRSLFQQTRQVQVLKII